MLSHASRSGIFFLVPRPRNDGNLFVQSVIARNEAIQKKGDSLFSEDVYWRQCCGKASGSPESRLHFSGKVSGNPESRLHSGGKVSGNPESRLHFGGKVSGNPESRPHSGGKVSGNPESCPHSGGKNFRKSSLGKASEKVLRKR